MPWKDRDYARQKAREQYYAIKADPVLLAEYRKRKREAKQRKYQANPEFAEKEKASARAWYHKNKERANTNRRNWDRKHAAAKPGICEICKRFIERLYKDHCHVTGKQRGLICHNCNTVLGHARDNPTVLSEAIVYLARYAELVEHNPC